MAAKTKNLRVQLACFHTYVLCKVLNMPAGLRGLSLKNDKAGKGTALFTAKNGWELRSVDTIELRHGLKIFFLPGRDQRDDYDESVCANMGTVDKAKRLFDELSELFAEYTQSKPTFPEHNEVIEQAVFE